MGKKAAIGLALAASILAALLYVRPPAISLVPDQEVPLSISAVDAGLIPGTRSFVMIDSAEGRPWTWSPGAAHPLVAWPDTTGIERIAVHPQGGLAALASVSGQIHLVRVGSRERVRTYAYEGEQHFLLAFTSDGRKLALASFQGWIDLVDLDTPDLPPIRLRHANLINALACSPTEPDLLATGEGEKVQLWSVSKRAILRTHSASAIPDEIAFSPDGILLAAMGNDFQSRETDKGVVTTGHGALDLWSVSSGVRLNAWKTPKAIRAMAFRSGGRQILTAENDGRLRGRNLRTGSEEFALKFAPDLLKFVRFTPDGQGLISADQKAVRTWRLTTETDR